MALAIKIHCNGIQPTKAMIYTLAAELVETESIKGFKAAIMEAMKSYDYDYNCDYNCDYEYYYHAYDYYDYSRAYAYDYFSLEEKIIALLFLAAAYSGRE